MATARMPQPQPAKTETSKSESPAPLVPQERRPHLRIVRPGEKQRFHLRLTPRTGIAVTVLLFVALFAVAVSHALLIEGQGRLDRLEQQVAKEQARYEEQQVERANLEAPERILSDAEALGMVEPEEVDWLAQSQAVDRDSGGDEAEESPDTSYPDVKPYLDTTP